MDSSESAGPMKVPGNPDAKDSSHSLRRCTGVAKTRSRSGHLLPRYRVWRFRLLPKNGQRLGERQYCNSILPNTSGDPSQRMFRNKRYAQASVAFLRAGRKREVAICDAYLLREKARSTSIITSAVRAQAFITAANAFITCAQDSPSKQVRERLAYYGTAGECYKEARDLKNAGNSYRMAEQYAAAARTYREGGYFDELVEVITRHGNALDSGLLERLTKVAQMYYFKVNFDECPVPKYL